MGLSNQVGHQKTGTDISVVLRILLSEPRMQLNVTSLLEANNFCRCISCALCLCLQEPEQAIHRARRIILRVETQEILYTLALLKPPPCACVWF